MIPKVNKDFLVNDAKHEDVELVIGHGHVAESADGKLMERACRKKVANNRLEEYMTWGYKDGSPQLKEPSLVWSKGRWFKIVP